MIYQYYNVHHLGTGRVGQIEHPQVFPGILYPVIPIIQSVPSHIHPFSLSSDC